MDIAVVGAGRAGTALAVLLRRAGHVIVGVSGSDGTAERAARYLEGVPVLDAAVAASQADVVVLGVPDDAIADLTRDLAAAGAFREGRVVAHLSGAGGLDLLAAASEAGASVLSLHPLQTFPSVDAALDRVAGAAFAVTAGDERAEQVGISLARDVGGRPFVLADTDKATYHAAAVFASNYVVAVLGAAEELFSAVGVPEPLEAMAPLARASLDNALSAGPVQALTGPVVRGDADTVARNLRALAPSPARAEAYAALARMALHLAEQGGLSKEGAAAIREVLSAWR
jgi:predicted short-subunit dehydrogenase-like oxidoreductase (DUF2520 family)